MKSDRGASLGQFVEEEIDSGNLAVPSDDEVGSGVLWRFTRAAGHPSDAPSFAHLFRGRERPIPEVWLTGLDYADGAIDLFAPSVNTAIRIVEYRVFVKSLIDHRTSSRRVDLTKYVIQIAKQ